MQIKDYSQVKRINGARQGIIGPITYLILSTKNGTKLAKIETSGGDTEDTDFNIEDSEEIIGIYGHESDD